MRWKELDSQCGIIEEMDELWVLVQMQFSPYPTRNLSEDLILNHT